VKGLDGQDITLFIYDALHPDAPGMNGQTDSGCQVIVARLPIKLKMVDPGSSINPAL
jgi:hypothetical protein